MTLASDSQLDKPSPEEVRWAFFNGLRLRKGFGIVFLQCSPAKATELIKDAVKELPHKSIATLNLTEPIDNLYNLVDQRPDKAKLNILFIRGLEKSLEPYIKPGYGGEGDYYNLDTVPQILSHLNQQRENFRDRFGNICFVFVLPSFGVKYFIRRAPDFFDWSSGVFKISSDLQSLDLVLNTVEYQPERVNSLGITDEERTHRILEIQSCLDESWQSIVHRVRLWSQQGDLFIDGNDFESALASYQEALRFEPLAVNALMGKGLSLENLERYEEAIKSYRKALVVQPDHWGALQRRGDCLIYLERYEDALTDYDQALKIKPDLDQAWSDRGYSLRVLGRHEEAIESYRKALTISPNDAFAWNQLGISLTIIGSYSKAVKSYDFALKHDNEFYWAWFNRGNALKRLSRYQAAIASYQKAIEIEPEHYWSWYEKASSLCRIGRSEEGVDHYDKAIEINPEYSTAHHNRALALSGIGRYEEAVEGFRKAIELQPEFDAETSWMCLGGALRSLNRYEESLACFNKSLELGKNPRHSSWGGRVLILLRSGRLWEAFLSAVRTIITFRADRGFREWVERRVAISLRQLGLGRLVPLWTWLLQVTRWRVRDW